MKLVVLFVTVLVALVAAGCGANEPSSSAVDSPETTMLEPPDQTTTTSPSTPATTGGEGGVPADFVASVVAAAADRAGVDVSEVTVVEAASVDWPDGSLGCPEPGMLYTQVITPGYQVVVSAGGEQFDYRLTRRGAFRLCETGAIPNVRDPEVSIPSSTSPDS